MAAEMVGEMNAARLFVSLMLVSIPALALPVARRTDHPKPWALVTALCLGSGFVLIEVSLIHASLPVVFTMMGLRRLAEACRSLGGHLFGAAPPFGVFSGLLAVLIAGQAVRGARAVARTHRALRAGTSLAATMTVGTESASLLPLRNGWAVAVPGPTPQVILSTNLLASLGSQEISAVVDHEMAHLRHHHARFLLLGSAVGSGLGFLPWMRRGARTLQLLLEEWADLEATSDSPDTLKHIKSALAKLTRFAPSALANFRLKALERIEAGREDDRRMWGWSTVASGVVPLAMAMAITLVVHLVRVFQVAAGAA